MSMTKPTLDDIRTAALRIEKYIHRTPVFTSRTINSLTGGEIFFKAENMQKVGAFKARGASNAVFSLTDEEASKGVATASSGNHGQALALAAKMRGIKAYVVMPENAPQVKKDAVAGYGAEIFYCKPIIEDRQTQLDMVIKKTGAVMIHPYDDPRIIAGQGTAALELIEDTGKLDVITTPVGGGGLLSGIAIATKGVSPETKIIAAEPENANDAYRSFTTGIFHPSIAPDSIADGLLSSLGELTFEIIKELVSEIVTVSEKEIIQAMKLVWERMKIIIEPSSAVPVAALLNGKIDARGKRVGLVISGGNVDLEKLPF